LIRDVHLPLAERQVLAIYRASQKAEKEYADYHTHRGESNKRTAIRAESYGLTSLPPELNYNHLND